MEGIAFMVPLKKVLSFLKLIFQHIMHTANMQEENSVPLLNKGQSSGQLHTLNKCQQKSINILTRLCYSMIVNVAFVK